MFSMKSRVNTMDTVVQLHILSYEDGFLEGIIYSEYYNRQRKFYDLCGMLSAMESLYDTLSFPQATYQHRSFTCATKFRGTPENEEMNSMARRTQAKGEATFVIHVQFRQNATWQGTIQWVDEKKEQHFRSTLEMLRLLDDALADGNTRVDWEDIEISQG